MLQPVSHCCNLLLQPDFDACVVLCSSIRTIECAHYLGLNCTARPAAFYFHMLNNFGAVALVGRCSCIVLLFLHVTAVCVVVLVVDRSVSTCVRGGAFLQREGRHWRSSAGPARRRPPWPPGTPRAPAPRCQRFRRSATCRSSRTEPSIFHSMTHAPLGIGCWAAPL